MQHTKIYSKEKNLSNDYNVNIINFAESSASIFL